MKLVTARDAHQEQVIETLRTLLADAEAGEIVALTEYRTYYREVQTGCRNTYSMAGAHFVAATRLANT